MSKVPKLRFKEFSGDWESKTVKQLMNEKIIEQPLDGNHGEIHPTTNDYVETGIPFIMASDLYNGKVDYLNCKYISEETAKWLRKGFAKEGDVLITHKATIGEIALVKNIDTNYIVLTPQVTYYRVNDYSILNNIYLKSYFESANFMNTFKKIASDGSTRSYIGITKQQELDIRYPKIEEQEKIASFFSLIDDKISLQGEKVEALKDYKRGMMQKIFSRELRFKDDEGRDYPDWEEKKLGELIKVKSNRNKNSVVDLVLSVSNTKGFITQSEQFEDRVVASSDISNYKIVEKNDFAFNPARINVGSIARLKLYDKGIISPMYICFRCLDLLDNDYLEYFLMTHSFDVQMKKKLEGSVRQTLSAEALGEIRIGLPCLDEQKKIGRFLNSINDKIEKEQEKLDSLNEYKKGLLQQMFV